MCCPNACSTPVHHPLPSLHPPSQTPDHTPHGRGYDTSLNYFSHKNDFWSQANMQTCCESDQSIIDFWHTDKGASTLNSTGYSEFLYQVRHGNG